MQDDAQADIERTDGNQEGDIIDRNCDGPPKASLARRSQSYSDFHDAVKATLGLSTGNSEKRHSQLGENTEITTELDFVDWYHNLEHDLLDASHEEYKSVAPLLPLR